MCSYLFSHLFTQISFLCVAKNEGTQSSLSLVNKLCNINTPKIIEGCFSSLLFKFLFADVNSSANSCDLSMMLS